jgi:hypothetical protein
MMVSYLSYGTGQPSSMTPVLRLLLAVIKQKKSINNRFGGAIYAQHPGGCAIL